MSVIRQQQWYGQQRVDAPHLRAMESGVAGDFDLLAGRIIAGTQPLIVKGFTVITTNFSGAPATSLQVSTAGSLLIHYLASESGSIFSVPADRATETLSSSNTRIRGSFTANATNYLGLDLRRSLDSNTADVIQFINTATQAEIAQRVALARTLDYVFVISTTDFSALSGVCPIAKIVTDVNNNVVTVEDARNLLGRLGSGGTVPNPQHAYGWPGGRLLEVSDDFGYGDRSIDSLKTWMDAAMTRMWELGGGEHWYAPTADRNVVMMRSGTTFSNGEWFEWDGTHLHWRGLRFVFDNSSSVLNLVADQTTDASGVYGTTATNLADGDCIYVDLDRSSVPTLNAIKAAMSSLGTPSVPGSRYIIAWRSGTNIYTRNSSFPVGSTFTAATTSALGIVKLYSTSGTPSSPVVFNPDANGTLNVASTTGNNPGVLATGHGTAPGVNATGGGTDGDGVKGTAVGAGAGVKGMASNTTSSYTAGSGTVAGVFLGKDSGLTAGGSDYGLIAIGGGHTGYTVNTGNAYGVVGVGGSGGSYGVYGEGGPTAGVGVVGQGTTSGAGVIGFGGATGDGLKGVGGASGGYGVEATAQASGTAAVYATQADANSAALQVNGGNATISTGFTNAIAAKNIPKAWLTIKTNGSSGYHFAEGFNIKTTGGSLGYSLNGLVVNFQNAMADANFAVMITAYNGTSSKPVFAVALGKSTAGFGVFAYDDTGASVHLDTVDNVTIDLVVFGQQ